MVYLVMDSDTESVAAASTIVKNKKQKYAGRGEATSVQGLGSEEEAGEHRGI